MHVSCMFDCVGAFFLSLLVSSGADSNHEKSKVQIFTVLITNNLCTHASRKTEARHQRIKDSSSKLQSSIYLSICLFIYLSHSLGDRWGTTRPGNQHSPFLSFLCSPHGVAQFQTRPIPNVIFPSFSLSASLSPSPYSALEDCLGKSRGACYMPIPPHFASFNSGQEFFVGSNGFPNPASHLFVGAVVSVRDAKETSETAHSTVCIFLFISAVNVQVSQKYKNMDMIKERNRLIFELRSMFLSSQMILSFVSVAMFIFIPCWLHRFLPVH